MGKSYSIMASSTFCLTRNGKPVDPPKFHPESTTLKKFFDNCDITKNKKGTLLTCTNRANIVPARLNNSFVGAIFDAYSKHYKLALRPDDVWLAIIIAFADYIDNHAEEMRKAFVTFEGKHQLIVHASSGSWIVGNWAGIISQFSDLINSNTVGSVRDWIEPKFTTTTDNDSLVARVSLMGAMKNYFAYGCSIECGIPEVTLMGTLDDWKQLRNKIDRLTDYGTSTNQQPLLWWHQVLAPILDEFVSSYQGQVNNNFWQSCANYIGGGSGPSYVGGWVLAFSPFKKGKWRIASPDNIKKNGEYGRVETTDFETSATVEVPLKVNDNGLEYEAYFYAGGMVNTYDKENNIIRPNFDFAMFEVPKGTIKDEIDWSDPSVKPVKQTEPLIRKAPLPKKSVIETSPIPGVIKNNFTPKFKEPDTLAWPGFKPSVESKPDYSSNLIRLSTKRPVISIKQHSHELHLCGYGKMHACDICNVQSIPVGYRCDSGCDYDICMTCADKN